MRNTFEEDRKFIERKYHNPDEPFNPYERIRYHGEGYEEASGLDDSEILEGLNNMQEELKLLPHPVAKAQAIRYVLEKERLYVNEHDYFVGFYSLNRLASTVTSRIWSQEAEQKRSPELRQLDQLFNESGAVSIWSDYDHVVPDWDSLMKLGIRGILERAQNYEQQRRDGVLGRDGEQAWFTLLTTQEWVQPSTNVIWDMESFIHSNIMNHCEAAVGVTKYPTSEEIIAQGVKEANTNEALPQLLMDAETTQEYNEVKNLIIENVNSNIAHFVLGNRSLDEFDDYCAELEAMGVERYVELAQESYDMLTK